MGVFGFYWARPPAGQGHEEGNVCMAGRHDRGFPRAEDDTEKSIILSPAPPPRRPLGRRKRVAFSLVALVLAWVVLEVGGFVLYALLRGEVFSWAKMQDRRRDVMRRMEEVYLNH